MREEYFGLLTLDLKSVSNNVRNNFNELLENMNFNKVEGLTTTWTFYFETKENAISIVEQCIEHAKNKSGVTNLKYAIQLGTEKVTIK